MTEIKLTNDGTAYWSVGDYKSGEKLNDYRGDITRIAESGYDTLLNKADRRFKDNIYVNTPFLMKTQSGKYLNLQQVGCTGYDYYKLRVIPGERTLYSSIYVDGLNQKVITLPYNTQWQTIGVAESASDLLASDLVYNLSVEEDEEKEKYTHPISRYNNFCYNNVILQIGRAHV